MKDSLKVTEVNERSSSCHLQCKIFTVLPVTLNCLWFLPLCDQSLWGHRYWSILRVIHEALISTNRFLRGPCLCAWKTVEWSKITNVSAFDLIHVKSISRNFTYAFFTERFCPLGMHLYWLKRNAPKSFSEFQCLIHIEWQQRSNVRLRVPFVIQE